MGRLAGNGDVYPPARFGAGHRGRAVEAFGAEGDACSVGRHCSAGPVGGQLVGICRDEQRLPVGRGGEGGDAGRQPIQRAGSMLGHDHAHTYGSDRRFCLVLTEYGGQEICGVVKHEAALGEGGEQRLAVGPAEIAHHVAAQRFIEVIVIGALQPDGSDRLRLLGVHARGLVENLPVLGNHIAIASGQNDGKRHFGCDRHVSRHGRGDEQ